MESESAVWELAERQHGVVARRQLTAIGIDHQRLRPMLERGSIRTITPQVYRVAGTPTDPRQDAMTAVLDAPPGAAASHQTAAALWGLPGFDLRAPFHVIIPRQGVTERTRTSILHFQKDLPLSELHMMGAIPVTSPALTLFNLAAVLHPAKTARTVDNALARHLLSPTRFRDLVESLAKRGRNGSRVARALAHERHESYTPPESGLEHRVEWCADRAGVQVVRQVALGDHEFVGRVDFKLRGLPGVVEAQSALHHSTPLDRLDDQHRGTRLVSMGLSVLFIWDHQAFGEPDLVIDELRAFRRTVASGTVPFLRTCGSPPF